MFDNYPIHILCDKSRKVYRILFLKLKLAEPTGHITITWFQGKRNTVLHEGFTVDFEVAPPYHDT